jgi:hypothetical protein
MVESKTFVGFCRSIRKIGLNEKEVHFGQISSKFDPDLSTSTKKEEWSAITKSKTVTFQNSFYIKACRTWNTLPISLRNLTLLYSFKRCLLNYYFLLTSNVYNPKLPHTYKTVCVICHKARPLDSLSDTLCC